MNKLVKTAVAGALALGATSAFAIGLPSTNNSDLILYVDALNSSGTSVGVYAIDTKVSLSSLMPGGFVTGASNNSTAFSGTTLNLASSGLSSFISSNAGDTFGWTLEGGQYSGSGTNKTANSTNSLAPGSALAIFTSQALTTALPAASTATTVPYFSFLNGLQTDISVAGLTGLQTSTETTGYENQSPYAPSKYGFFGQSSDLAATGSSAITLFGFTGNNVKGGTLQSYILGNATLSSTGVLQINPNQTSSTVPLPAAVWLFGSGLMGLVGVSRRRKSATPA